MIHPASKQWPHETDRATAKADQQRKIIRAKKWWSQKTGSDWTCQTSTPCFKSETCCCPPAWMSPGNRQVCYHVVKVPLSFTNELWLLLLASPCPALSIIPSRFSSSNRFFILPSFLHSLHLCPPLSPSRTPGSNTLSISAYETNCFHPSPFKNLCLDLHILLLLRSLRYILPTFIY